MLTRRDQTVADCLEVWDYVASLGLRHVGFKDVGTEPAVLRELNRRIQCSGAISYMEVVSTSAEAALKSARFAREIGVDRLLGGTQVAATLAILQGSAIDYFPFPGRPHDHPTKLGGSAEEIEEHCRQFRSAGCAGVDLLAFRATETDPLDLVRAARRGMDGLLVIAGSIEHKEQIKALKRAGADAFTIGSAAFAGSLAPCNGSLRTQLRQILDACG